MINLRDYQKEFINKIRASYLSGAKSPLAQGPTGMGKTRVLSFIAEGASKNNKNTLILVHRKELIIQTSLALAEAGVWHKICAQGSMVKEAIKNQTNSLNRSFYNTNAKVMIASVQTLVNRMNDYEAQDFILIDEAHHGVAGSWLKIINAYPKAKMLGVTATPERLDGRGLGTSCGGIFDDLIIGPSIKNLILEGYLAKPRIFAPPVDFNVDGIKTIAGDFSKRDVNDRINRPTITGDVINHYKKICDGVPAIAFCLSVEHAKDVAEKFRLAGYNAECIDGNMEDYKRRQAIEGLGNGRINILTSCDIVSEGTDIPIVGAAILLRPTKSLGLYLQQVGRVLRKYDGKEYAYILDHVGNVERHGMIDEERDWTLEGRSKRNGGKKLISSKDAFRQCMKCYAIFPDNLDICPICKTKVEVRSRELDQVDGELVEIDGTNIKKQMKIEQAKADSIEELTKLGKARGYKNPFSWAVHVFNGRRRK